MMSWQRERGIWLQLHFLSMPAKNSRIWLTVIIFLFFGEGHFFSLMFESLSPSRYSRLPSVELGVVKLMSA